MTDFAIIGFGSRGTLFAGYIKENANMRLTAVVDVCEEQLVLAQKEYGVSADRCYRDYRDFYRAGKIADAVIVASQDADHYAHTIPALEAGYDVLLEKPVANRLEDCIGIRDKANALHRKVMVCHVLRYSHFYDFVKKIIDGGEIGRVININQTENVGYWHYAHSFIRGAWRNSDTSSPMILAKCCHDLDLLQWYAKSACDTVSSVGALTFFKEENTPEGAAKRCTDCRYEQTCPYSAVKYYIESWKRAGCPENIWPINILTQDFPLTEEKILQALKTGNYGRCVFACDNDVVDHQHVSMTFTNGVNATLTMMAFTQDCGRVMRFFGTYGEIVLDEQKNVIEVGIFGKERENISINKLVEGGYGHGGGDTGLVEELYRVLTGESNNPTSLAASVESHLMGIRAEESMRCGGQRLKVHKN